MSPISAIKPTPLKPLPPNFSWKDSLTIQALLDVICRIIADEYAATAKQHPELFLTKE